MGRLNKDRQISLEPKRINYAVSQITALGYPITNKTSTQIDFEFNGNNIMFFPYSGWFSGKGVGSGRGLQKLIEKLTK
jgi:hypothetical protein